MENLCNQKESIAGNAVLLQRILLIEKFSDIPDVFTKQNKYFRSSANKRRIRKKDSISLLAIVTDGNN